ncbi:MAG: sulfatase-like hydrolase/transferase [Armatimonadota bacterium]|jgi:arylsulfatase A-like enzyme
MQRETRRDFLRRTGAAAAGASLIGRRPVGAEGAGPDREPSVLIIMCDQLAASCLSCYGGAVPTPNIDRIAREGVQFDQATCPTPFCSPTRGSIVSGLYPHAHGIVANCRPGRQAGITPEDVTTERILHESGYATHHYGKWHLRGEPLPYYTDTYDTRDYVQEMAETFERVRAADPDGFMPWYACALPVEVAPELQRAVDGLGDRWKDQRFAGFITKMGRLKLPLKDHLDVRIADRTVDRLKALGQERFMVTCSFIAPHDPNIVPSPYYERFPPDAIQLPANWQNHEPLFEKQWSRRIVADLGQPGLREFLRVYYAMVALIDDQVGRVLEALDATGQADDTVLIFTADHGDMMGGHGMVWKSTSAFYDEVARVPLLIRYPRKLQPGRSDMAACLTGMMPTILELLGKPVPDNVQGRSLAPVLMDAIDEVPYPYTFSERVRVHPEGRREVRPGTPGSFMIRGQGWKYVRYSPENEFLYHLAEDPGETENLAGRAGYAAAKADLSAEMDRWLRDTGFPVQ